ncbi:MAG: radical SAM protein [Candidatus Auribacterota bacterium]
MKNQLSYLLYGFNYLLKTKLLGKNIPFIGGLVLNEKCNLRCTHCKVSNRDIPDLSYNDVEKGLSSFYAKGIRSVFIEGGEPFLWKDRAYQLEDVVILARKIGFKVVSIYTNGTFPIKSSADTVFVSLDGVKETNNLLRDNSYDRVMTNIANSTHKKIIINFTINKKNIEEIEPFCNETKKIKQIKGIFFYFHTPYYGIDDLFVSFEEKQRAIKKILELKRRGYKIFNSKACLKSVYNDTWKRPSELCYVYAENKLYTCCRAIGNDDVCANCGYLGYPEIINILALKPSAILEALHYLPRN